MTLRTPSGKELEADRYEDGTPDSLLERIEAVEREARCDALFRLGYPFDFVSKDIDDLIDDAHISELATRQLAEDRLKYGDGGDGSYAEEHGEYVRAIRVELGRD